MPGRRPQTNRFLVLTAVLLCVFLGGTLTKSSARTSAPKWTEQPEMIVADGGTAFTSEPLTESKIEPEDSSVQDGETLTDAPAPSVTPDPQTEKNASDKKNVSDKKNASDKNKKTEKESFKVSPEAAAGVWTSSGSKWMFLTEGVPYTGWLTDTDGNRYYFDDEGIMQTGWLDAGKKRYYLNLDGILQTGDVTVGGEVYHLRKDGSLKGYVPESKPKKKQPKKDKQPEKKMIALTFDDGPGSFTGRLLDCLEANNAKATFFMLGTQIESFPDEVKRMAKLGFELGNHTYHHKDLSKLTTEEIRSEIGSVDQALVDLTGMGAAVVRAPYGSINDNVIASVGTPMIIWSIDTLDWKTLDVQQTVDTVMNEVEDGSIILMHDIYSQTVDAAEILIPKLIEEGYELVTVHELAAAKGKELKPGIAYGAIN